MRAVPTPAAREDILAQFRYCAVDQGAPDVGFRFLDAVEAAITRVGEMPAIGAPQHFGTPALADVRAWPVPGFEDIRLDHLATADVLLIVRVLHDKSFGDEGDQTRFRLEGSWRFAKRHKVRAMIFSISREDSREFDREIEWEEEVFPVGTRVKGEVDFAVYQVACEYLFLRRETWELGASIGVHYTTFETKLSATVETPGGTGSGTRSADADLNAPLPVIGLHGTWGVGRNHSLDATAQFFSLSIDEYSWSLQDYRVGLTWQPKSWVGVGIGNYSVMF